MFVKAKDGLKIRDPRTGNHLAERGAEVPETAYWNRRLSTGDVYLADKEAAPSIKAETAAEPSGNAEDSATPKPTKSGKKTKE